MFELTRVAILISPGKMESLGYFHGATNIVVISTGSLEFGTRTVVVCVDVVDSVLEDYQDLSQVH